jgi:hypothetical protein
MLPGEMMATEDTMTIDEMYKYLRRMRSRYNKADRVKKGELLSEMEAVTGRHRKSLIRLLGGSLERSPRRKQRTRTYKANFDRALGVIYDSYGRICAERLHPNLVALAEQLATHGELKLTEKLKAQLTSVSLTTVADLGYDGSARTNPRNLGGHREARTLSCKTSLWDAYLGTSQNPATSKWILCIIAARPVTVSMCIHYS